MKKLFNVLKALATLGVMCFLVYVFFFYKMPPRVNNTQKFGIEIKDSLFNGREWYTFKNTTLEQKIILGFDFIPMETREPEPLFKVVLKPKEIVLIEVPSRITSQIRICELNCEKADLLPLAYINTYRLRNGEKD